MKRSKKLTAAFFRRTTLTVARDLLGKYLVVKHGREILSGKIVETEAYVGGSDLACHASKGRTPRTACFFTAPFCDIMAEKYYASHHPHIRHSSWREVLFAWKQSGRTAASA